MIKNDMKNKLINKVKAAGGDEEFVNTLIETLDKEDVVRRPIKCENTLKYAVKTVKNHPRELLFSRNTLNLSQNKL